TALGQLSGVTPPAAHRRRVGDDRRGAEPLFPPAGRADAGGHHHPQDHGHRYQRLAQGLALRPEEGGAEADSRTDGASGRIPGRVALRESGEPPLMEDQIRFGALLRGVVRGLPTTMTFNKGLLNLALTKPDRLNSIGKV